MSRSCPYRREISEACNWHQCQALEANIFILSQTGPVGFLLKEDGENKNFKVFLGDVHNCTCPVFKKEKDLCKHICWILLKKFRIPRNDSRTWQLGLCEREINQVIRFEAAAKQQQADQRLNQFLNKKPENKNEELAPGELEQRPINAEDICPICQDDFLLKKLPVTYCRFGCGNNVHIKCMKVWADHQKSSGEQKLTCPLCRELFCSFELLDQEYRNNSLFKAEKQDLHYGLSCKSCRKSPISGKCYKCTVCTELYLCQPCFNTDYHKEHKFVFREKITQNYHKATRDHVGAIPAAVAISLANRDIREQDYDLLLQLDQSQNKEGSFSQIPEKVIKSWKSEKIRDNCQLLGPGFQCRICLRPYQLNQMVRKLPGCNHKFHLDCIDNWLLHSHPTCPIDGQVVWDPIADQQEKEEKRQKQLEAQQLQQNLGQRLNPTKDSISSLGLIINYKQCVVESKPPKGKVELTKVPLVTSKSGFQSQKSTPDKNKTSISSRRDIQKRSNNNLNNSNSIDNIGVFASTSAAANNNIQSSNENETSKFNNKKGLKPLIKNQLEKNKSASISTQHKMPQIEVKGNRFSKQKSSDVSLNNSQLSNYSNRNQFIRTALPKSNAVSMSNISDDVLLHRKHSLTDNRRNVPDVFSLNTIMGTNSNYQLTRSNINNNPGTSDFYKDTYDSVDIDNIYENNNHNAFQSENVYDYITNNHEQIVPSTQTIRRHSINQDNLTLHDRINPQTTQDHSIITNGQLDTILNGNINMNAQLTHHINDSSHNGEAHNESFTDTVSYQETLTNQPESSSSSVKQTKIEFKPNQQTQSQLNNDAKKKLLNSRIKVNFNKKLSNPNPDIADLSMNLPMAVGIQPIFVNNSQNSKSSDQE